MKFEASDKQRAIIEQVLAVWQEFPHLRLCQLLTNACGSTIYYTKDDALVRELRLYAERHGK